MTVVMAAPTIPYFGIKTRFNKKLLKALIPIIMVACFCLSIELRNIIIGRLRKTIPIDQITIFNGMAAGKYVASYINTIKEDPINVVPKAMGIPRNIIKRIKFKNIDLALSIDVLYNLEIAGNMAVAVISGMMVNTEVILITTPYNPTSSSPRILANMIVSIELITPRKTSESPKGIDETSVSYQLIEEKTIRRRMGNEL